MVRRLVPIAAASVLALSGCEDSPAEERAQEAQNEMNERIDEAADRADEELEGTSERIDEAVEEAEPGLTNP